MKQIQREYIIDEFMKDKIYKQQVYAAQKLIENEERIRLRRIDIAYEHHKVIKEQQEVLRNLEYLTNVCNKWLYVYYQVKMSLK